MEILFITHKYPPFIGGMEKQSYELTTRMGACHTIHIHTYDGEGSKLSWFLNLKKKVKKILSTNPNIELIHVNDGLMASACLWLKKYTQIPVVATFHGLDLTFPSYIFQKFIVKRLHRLEGAICVSNATTLACLERGFSKEKVFTVLNGVDHDLADIPIDVAFKSNTEEALGISFTGKKVMVTMGRAVKRKGFSWFLKHVVPELNESIVFLMIGPLNNQIGFMERVVNILPITLRGKIQLMFGMATDVKSITAALKDPSISKKVHHLGKVSFTDLMQYLSLADVFVMPNIKVKGDAEGFGLVALEASLRGAPVVAAGIEGITDAVRDGKNGILVPSGDADRWIHTLNTLLEDEEGLSRMSDSAVQFTLEDYGWDKMVEEYERVFLEIVTYSSNKE
ncbi:MAG: glycosyltransferase family 4 protein [Saprospiraceae bacterium]|nr:glycosyltransferase family 4 protein [Saprospiraceae bacterium]